MNMPMAEGIKPGYGLPTIVNPDNPSKAFIRQREPRDRVVGPAGNKVLAVIIEHLGRLYIRNYYITSCITSSTPRGTTPTSRQGAVTASPLFKAARGILTADELFLWRKRDVTHAMIVRLTGIDGVRIRLAHSTISVHQETVSFPEHSLFVYTDFEAAGEQTLEVRRAAVERWLRSNPHLRTIHPGDFAVDWYM